MAAEVTNQQQLSEEGFWSVIPLRKFREKDLVKFSMMNMKVFPRIDGVDHVVHKANAHSPGFVGETLGWYLHPHQQDNLLVFVGERTSSLRRLGENQPTEVFTVTANSIKRNGKIIFEGGPAVLRWEKNVFHRVDSGPDGSVSLNFAVRSEGFDLNHEFDIHSLDEKTGEHKVIRFGKEDQS